MCGDDEAMELLAIHKLEEMVKESVLDQTVNILNYEWPRSDTIRRRGLLSSSPDLPSNLVLVQKSNGKGVDDDLSVLGHSRISKIPADPNFVFVESVVIHPQLR